MLKSTSFLNLKRTSRLKAMLFTAIVSSIIIPSTGYSKEENTLELEQKHQFSIPSQNMMDALSQFSKITHIEIMGDASFQQNVIAHQVKGTMTAEKALETILADTGLMYQMNGTTVIIIKSDKKPSVGKKTYLERNIEEITVIGSVSTFGATKSDIPILETARSIKVIDAKEFLERGALTIDDTLNYTAGVVGDTYGFSTRGDFATVRGLDIPEFLDNVQVLFGFYNNARSDIYTLEQVEILKGPASVLYGQGSPGGIINTISKKANKNHLTNEVMVDYGTHNRVQAAADLSYDFSGDGVVTGRLVALYRDSETQVDQIKDNAFVIAPSLTFQNEDTTLTALVNYTNRKGDIAQQFSPLSLTGCNNDDITISLTGFCAGSTGKEISGSTYMGHKGFNKYNAKSLSATVFAEQILSDIFSVEATARYRDSEVENQQTWLSFLGTGVARALPNGRAKARTWAKSPATSEQFAIDARFRAKIETDTIYHEILAGVNYQDVKTTSNAVYLWGRPTTLNLYNPKSNAAEIPTEAAFNAGRSKTENNVDTFGLYINYQLSFDALILNAGLRHDKMTTDNGTISQKDNATNISVGGLYKTSFGLNPYVSYAESFQTVVGLDNVTKNPLKPQKGKQIEVGFKFNPEGSSTYITAAYFDIKQSNLANAAGLRTAPSQQEGVAKIKGFEFEAKTSLNDFSLDGSFSIISTKDANGHRLSSVPKFQGSAWVTWNPSSADLDGFRIGMGARHVGENKSVGVTYVTGAPSLMTITTKGYTVFDALIAYKWNDIDFTLNARNLFNKEFYTTCLARGDCFVGEKRTIVARAAYRF